MKFTTVRHSATQTDDNAATPADIPVTATKRNSAAIPQKVTITGIELSVFDWLGIMTKLFLATLLFLIPVIGIVVILLTLPGLF